MSLAPRHTPPFFDRTDAAVGRLRVEPRDVSPTRHPRIPAVGPGTPRGLRARSGHTASISTRHLPVPLCRLGFPRPAGANPTTASDLLPADIARSCGWSRTCPRTTPATGRPATSKRRRIHVEGERRASEATAPPRRHPAAITAHPRPGHPDRRRVDASSDPAPVARPASATAAAHSSGLTRPLTELALAQNQELANQGHGQGDNANLMRLHGQIQ
jgi:hypothetical protein